MKISFTIKKPKEILDKAFRRAREIKAHGKRIEDKKEKALNKVSTVENVINNELSKIVKSLPKIDSFSDFYKELFKSYACMSTYKKCLYHISWTNRKIRQLSNKTRKKIKTYRKVEEIKKEMRSFYGRVSSLIEDLEECLDYLIYVIKILRKFPEIDESKVAFVVAGYPNVGKSSLIKAITRADIKIEPYPFTTKDILIGNKEHYMLIDTPGLLEKNFEKLSDIEQKGYLALKYLSKNIIFVIDSTMTSGYMLEDQMELLNNIKRHFKPQNILIVYTKIDLLSDEDIKALKKDKSRRNVFFVSSITGEGLPELERELDKLSLQYLSSHLKSYRNKS